MKIITGDMLYDTGFGICACDEFEGQYPDGLRITNSRRGSKVISEAIRQLEGTGSCMWSHGMLESVLTGCALEMYNEAASKAQAIYDRDAGPAEAACKKLTDEAEALMDKERDKARAVDPTWEKSADEPWIKWHETCCRAWSKCRKQTKQARERLDKTKAVALKAALKKWATQK